MLTSIKILDTASRFWRTNIKRFGVYEKVSPVEITPYRVVPDHIEKPHYLKPDQKLEIPVSPEIKDVNSLRGMKRSCKLASSILNQLQTVIKPGVTTDAIDEFVHNKCIEAEAYPSPLLYNGFPKSICTSVNNVAVHGIPDLRPLKEGDIVTVDITVFYKGFHGDCARTFSVGKVDKKGQELVRVTEECLEIAIKACGPEVPFSEIGFRIYEHAKKNGLTVIPCVLGHGIGRYFHGPPSIYHTLNTMPGLMAPGMTFTIEPCLSHGSEFTEMLDDGWTLVTEDGSRTAQVEHTVLITEKGAEILTK